MSEWDPLEEIPIHVEESELVERPERLLRTTWVAEVEHSEDMSAHRHTRDHIQPIMIDAMSREIQVGDIINWRSGGYFSHFLSFGLVRRIDYTNGHIRVLNHNKNMVTLWHTHLCIILASEGDYSAIPEDYLKIWFKDE
jgi:hypothetical protein